MSKKNAWKQIRVLGAGTERKVCRNSREGGRKQEKRGLKLGEKGETGQEEGENGVGTGRE